MISARKKTNRKYYLLIATLALGIFFVVRENIQNSQAEGNVSSSAPKEMTLVDDGLTFKITTSAENVASAIAEQKINLKDQDKIYPEKERAIFSGATIIIQRAKKITVAEGGNSKDLYTFQNTVEKALWENKVDLGDDDFTKPARATAVIDGGKIAVTHVQINEEIKNVKIDFKTVSDEDDKLGWRVKKVTQKGEVGTKEVKYRVVYNDGKEISRKVLESNITKQPTDEIVTQGTMVKVGKVHTGAASWYAYTGELCAANPWLPMGSYVRVINQDNGKSVIVKINDRGPFGNGRIIDLDKVAFSKIASIGAGVVNVKMEVITN